MVFSNFDVYNEVIFGDGLEVIEHLGCIIKVNSSNKMVWTVAV